MIVDTDQDNYRGEIPLFSTSSKETLSPRPVGSLFGEIGRMEIQVFQPHASSRMTMHTTEREENTKTSEHLLILSEIIAGLENLCPLEGWNGVLTRRSPLPLWYPRRPLQDITAVLNSATVGSQESPAIKKETKKAQTVEPNVHIRTISGGTVCKQRAKRIPANPTSAAPTRSLMLRKGFR